MWRQYKEANFISYRLKTVEDDIKHGPEGFFALNLSHPVLDDKIRRT